MKANIWLVMTTQAKDEYKARKSSEDYSGPMDDDTFAILDKIADGEVVRNLFKRPTLGGKQYHMFSVYLTGNNRAKEAIDYLTTKWSGHFIVCGAWWMDGRQVGTRFTYDEDGNVTGVTGTPLYPIPAQAYRLMPDTVVYDDEGNEVSRTPASSNSDLQDVNLLQGQSPRRFV